jgi:hypothetical protein
MAISTTQIGTVTVPALVISFNGVLFTNGRNGYNGQEVIGKVLNVPCREILFDNVDSWAIPVKDAGIFTGLDFELKAGIYTALPTNDSFSVFRIRDKESNNYWMVYGTKADLIASCSTCCDGTTPIPMPGVSSFGVRIAPCQTMNILNTAGNPYMVFGIPTLFGSERYFPYGSLNNVALTPASASGYANTTLLLAFLNTNWTPYVWTLSVDGLTLTATGGVANSVLCVNVIGITPS